MSPAVRAADGRAQIVFERRLQQREALFACVISRQLWRRCGRVFFKGCFGDR